MIKKTLWKSKIYLNLFLADLTISTLIDNYLKNDIPSAFSKKHATFSPSEGPATWTNTAVGYLTRDQVKIPGI